MEISLKIFFYFFERKVIYEIERESERERQGESVHELGGADGEGEAEGLLSAEPDTGSIPGP